jgi:hypothetical protein
MRAGVVVDRVDALDFAGLTERIERVYHDGRLVFLQRGRPPRHDNSAATRAALIRYATTCYDHLAGEVGVGLSRALERDGVLLRRNATYSLGEEEPGRLEAFGWPEPLGFRCGHLSDPSRTVSRWPPVDSRRFRRECGHSIGRRGNEFRVVVEVDLALRLKPEFLLGRFHCRVEGVGEIGS